MGRRKKPEPIISKPSAYEKATYSKEHLLKEIIYYMDYYKKCPDLYSENENALITLLEIIFTKFKTFKTYAQPLDEFKSLCSSTCVGEDQQLWNVAQIEISLKKKSKSKVFIDGSQSVYRIFRTMWDPELIRVQEQICALFLSRSNEVIGFRVLCTGNMKTAMIDINLLIVCALQCRANSVVIAHNHPSGALIPSKADIDLTWNVKAKLSSFDIDLLDHLIITDTEYYSFVENKLVFEHLGNQ